MAVVRNLTRSLVEDILDESGLRFFRDNEGDWIIRMSYDDEANCEYDFYFILGGKNHDILALRGSSDRRVSKAKWPAAMFFCNEWNKDRRWPKACLSIGDVDAPFAKLSLEYDYDLEKGVTKEQLDDWITVFMFTSRDFWRWINTKDV